MCKCLFIELDAVHRSALAPQTLCLRKTALNSSVDPWSTNPALLRRHYATEKENEIKPGSLPCTYYDYECEEE